MTCSSCGVTLQLRIALRTHLYGPSSYSVQHLSDFTQHKIDCETPPCRYCGIPKNSFCHTFHKKCPCINPDTYHELWNTWYMNSPEYTSTLQWLPKEILEDITVLASVPQQRIFSAHNM